jgi:hypothetical protein
MKIHDKTATVGIPLTRLLGRTDDVIASIIETAQRFDMTKIRARYMREHNVPADVAEMHERELKRYLAICAIFAEPIGTRGDVDKFWHTLILFTRDYLSFCYLIAGEGNFIHHAPNVQEETSEPFAGADSQHDYVNFWIAYAYVFGETPPAAAWPRLP